MALLKNIATLKLLGDPAPRINPRIIIFHTMVGSLRGTDAHFRNRTALEAHFGVGGSSDGDLDGAIWQWVDTAREAEANRRANAFAISIETSDGGNENNPWSPKQIDSLVKLANRLCNIHEVPKRLVTSWNDASGGLGWHVMFGAPSNWTPVAKSCPGQVRIRQLKNVVFPRLGIGKPPHDVKETCRLSLPIKGSLSEGDEGAAVACWQAKWNFWATHIERHHHADPPEVLAEDGDFGPTTANATLFFKRRFKDLPDDAIVGKKAVEKMETAIKLHKEHH